MTEIYRNLSVIDSAVKSRLLLSFLLVLLVWLIPWAASFLAYRLGTDVKKRYRLTKTIGFAAVGAGLLMLCLVWINGMQSLITFLGLISAGLAIALKDLVVNAAGCVFILLRRPFEVGDRVAIGGHAGDVIDLRVFQFTLLEIGNWSDGEQSTGRVIHIPNGKAFTETVANYSKGFRYIWNEIPVLVTFDSDWRLAKATLQRIANIHTEHLSKEAETRVREASRRFMIYYSKLTPTVYTDVRDSGVQLTVRYLCQPQRRRDSIQAIWEDILTEFARIPAINLAYPSRRVYWTELSGRRDDKEQVFPEMTKDNLGR